MFQFSFRSDSAQTKINLAYIKLKLIFIVFAKRSYSQAVNLLLATSIKFSFTFFFYCKLTHQFFRLITTWTWVGDCWFENYSDSRIDSVRFANEFFKSVWFYLTAANRKVVIFKESKSKCGFLQSSDRFDREEQSSLSHVL